GLLELGGQVQVNSLFAVSRRDVELGNLAQASRPVAQLLFEFPGSGLFGSLTALDAASSNLEGVAAQRIAPLANKSQSQVFKHGKDAGAPVVVNYFNRDRALALRLKAAQRKIEHLALVNVFSFYQLVRHGNFELRISKFEIRNSHFEFRISPSSIRELVLSLYQLL